MMRISWKEKEKAINKRLKSYFKEGDNISQGLVRFMNYSLLSKGKRIRAILVLTAAQVLGKHWRRFLDAACGIEMIHLSSLILDDLPCMDDALMRRGKPALHRRAGEANAILVSYALLMEGIKLIAHNACALGVSSERFEQIVKSITESVGLGGISLGQFLDLKLSSRRYSLSEIKEVHCYKTASLFASALEIPAIICEANRKQVSTLKKYGLTLGLAFQIKDDLLGFEKKPKDLGKLSLRGTIGPNYVKLSGKEETNKKVEALIKKACNYLGLFANRSKTLQEIAYFIGEREE